MQLSKKTSALILAGIGMLGGAALTIGMQTHAATNTQTTNQNGQPNGRHQMTPPAAVGQVTAVSGSTINLTDKRSGTNYTIDASAATIEKFNNSNNQSGTGNQQPQTPTTISISDIQVGDTLMIQGTVNGTNITATKIMDGMPMMGKRGGHGPGEMGTVSNISGNTITLTTKDGKTLTVDGSSATVKKITDSSISSIAVGDTLMIQGTNNNGTITAKNIIDGQMPHPNFENNQNSNN